MEQYAQSYKLSALYLIYSRYIDLSTKKLYKMHQITKNITKKNLHMKKLLDKASK